ncbi:MAG: hypothetical protein JSV65_01580 [Armatimonadota bacterium]|nr:MAG: hypothetical protein JSV65_01580 [Armatimonadota bacterium]
MTGKLLAKDGAITAYEPLLVRAEIRNQCEHTVKLKIAREYTTRIEIRDGTGRVVAATRRPAFPIDLIHFEWALAPRQTRTTLLIVSALYQFKTPGKYAVRVQQLELSEDIRLIAECTVWVRVLPFDAARLRARCEELFQPLLPMNTEQLGDLSLSARTTALRSVRHDIVLPYLEWMACKWHDRYAVRAMRRMGTEQAERLVETLAARKDSVGQAAQQGLNMALEITSWDIFAD